MNSTINVDQSSFPALRRSTAMRRDIITYPPPTFPLGGWQWNEYYGNMIRNAGKKRSLQIIIWRPCIKIRAFFSYTPLCIFLCSNLKLHVLHSEVHHAFWVTYTCTSTSPSRKSWQTLVPQDGTNSLNMSTWLVRVILGNVRMDSSLFSILVNLSSESGPIMAIITRYDFLEARRVFLSNVQTDSNLT